MKYIKQGSIINAFIVLFLISSLCLPLDSIAQNKALHINVLTYNIHHGESVCDSNSPTIDLQGIADVINEVSPDFVALQEVDSFTWRSGIATNEAEELGRLCGMYAVFFKSFDYDGGGYGNAILSKYPIESNEKIMLLSSDDSAEPRCMGVIKVLIDGQQISFATTHLDHRESGIARSEQTTLLSEYVNGKIGNSIFIVAGDFNMTPDNRLWKQLKPKLQFIGNEKQLPKTYSSEFPNQTIDYFVANRYTRKNIIVESLDVLNTKRTKCVSDHLPLQLSFTINWN